MWVGRSHLCFHIYRFAIIRVKVEKERVFSMRYALRANENFYTWSTVCSLWGRIWGWRSSWASSIYFNVSHQMAALRLVSCENKGATDTRGRGVVPEFIFLYFQLDTLFSVYVQYLLSYFPLHVSGLTGPSSGGLNCTCSLWYSPFLQMSLSCGRWERTRSFSTAARQRHLQRGRVPQAACTI